MDSLILDLDGTLLDVSSRFYNVFYDIVKSFMLSKEEYWNYRRSGKEQRCLVKNLPIEDFNQQWLVLIEQEKYLAMDTLYPETIQFLQYFSRKINLILLTARMSKENLMQELSRLHIKEYFHAIYVTEKRFNKTELLGSILTAGTVIAYITDTVKDVEAANSLDITTIGITHGLLNKENILKSNPDFIIDNLTEATPIMNKLLRG